MFGEAENDKAVNDAVNDTVSLVKVAPGATVAPGARLAPGVVVAPGVIIEDDVVVGAGTHLLAGTVLLSGTRVGQGCTLGPYAVVGGAPMDSHYRGEATLVVLEDGVQLREFVSVHRATGEGNETRVGAGTMVMSYVHLSHNVRVGAHCTITTQVQLGGHVEVGDHAVIGSAAVAHQFIRVGAYAMFGAASAANQDLLPFTMARGNPARHYRLNGVGLRRHGFDAARYRALETALRYLRHRDLDALEELAAANGDARLLFEFINSSERGVARFVKAR